MISHSMQISRITRVFFAVLLAVGLLFTAFHSTQAASVPVISITAVQKDVNVTVYGVNFPSGQTFTVRMGAYGTLGIGGTVVGSYNSGSGAAFTATYTIPAALAGSYKIAIRMESAQGYYSYNWFYNNSTSPAVAATATSTAAATTPAATSAVTKTVTATPAATKTPVPGYTGIPTFSIVKVVKGSSVTIRTNNFPANQTFTARMGEYGTLGIGGTVVGTTASGAGGKFEVTYTIPAALAGRSKIAIRMDSPQGYYAFDWFNNVDLNTGSTSGTVTSTPSWTPVPGFTGIPTFKIYSVVKDSKVTINAINFPAGQTFTVRMGAYGTMGIGGTAVTTVDSGKGGSFTATYTIPSSLAGSTKIAIRLETANGYYYAYNWFYNNTTSN